MRKVFVSVIITVFMFAGYACAEVEPDAELHSVIGGLYSLAAAVSINDNPTPHINQLRQYFVNVPDNWHNQIQLSRVHKDVWAGIAVGKYSSARRFLRANAQELGLYESPEGYSWLGGDFVWLKLFAVKLKAAKGTGSDSESLFLSADGNRWWLSEPVFKKEASREILRRFGVKNAPELHGPSGVRESIYESVKPADVQKPADIHWGRKKSSFDMDIELGKDVIFDPIPNRRRN